MKQLFGHNLLLLFKKPKIWIIILMVFLIFGFMSFNVFKDFTGLEILPEMVYMRLLFQSIGLLTPLALIAFLINFFLQELLMLEKNSKRMEFLLATGVPVHSIWLGMGLAMAVVIIAVLYSLQAFILSILYYFNFSILEFFNLPFFVLWVFVFPLLALVLCLLLCGLGLFIRRNEMINTILFFAGFLLIFGGSHLASSYMERMAGTDHLVTPKLLGFFMLLITLLVPLVFIIGRNLHPERVVLSIPE